MSLAKVVGVCQLKEKHNPSNKQASDKPNAKSVTISANQPAPELIVKQPPKKTILQSREVLRWSGQTEVEASDAPFVPSSNVLPISQLINDDSVFITPFEVLESEPNIEKAATKEPSIIEQVEASIISDNTPACPKSNSEMVKRVAKKGQQQGQPFFGCSQFPKCRGVVNIN